MITLTITKDRILMCGLFRKNAQFLFSVFSLKKHGSFAYLLFFLLFQVNVYGQKSIGLDNENARCPLVIEAGDDKEICINDSITIIPLASCGAGNYTYSWSNGLGTGLSKTVSPSVPTMYTITVTDLDGNTATDSVFIDITETQTITGTASIKSSCALANGSIIVYFDDQVGRGNIEFSIDGGSTWPNNYSISDNADSIIINNIASGAYNVWTRWGDSDCPKEIGDVIVGDTSLYALTTSLDQVICFDEEVTITATASCGAGSYTYTWDNGLGSGASKTVSPTVPTTYTVAVVDGNSDTLTEEVFIDVTETQNITSIYSLNSSCAQFNGSIVVKFDDEPTRSGIEFSIDGGSNWPNSYNVADNSDSIVIDGLAAGSYDVWSRWGDNDCPKDVGDATIIDTAILSVNTGIDQEICFGDSITITAIAACFAGAVTYSWDNGLGTGASKIVSPTVPTTYTVTVTDTTGATATDEILIDITETQIITNINGINSSCGTANGQIIVYFDDVPGRSNIEFSIDGGATWPATYSVGDNSNFIEIQDVLAGTYDVWSRWGDGDCPRDVGNITVGDTTLLSVNVGIDEEICFGESVTLTAVSSCGAGTTTFSWNNGLGTGATKTVSPIVSTTYTVTVTDSLGATATDQVFIEVAETQEIISITTTKSSCSLANGSITINFDDEPTRGNIRFSIDGGTSWPGSYSVPDNSNSITIENLSSGSYNLWTSWGNNDCPKDIGNVTVMDTSLISVNAGLDQEICFGDDATITALGDCGAGTYTYSWDNGLGTGASKVVSPTVPTTYTVTVTDSLGATATDEVFIDVTETQNITSISTINSSCALANGSIVIHFDDEPGRGAIEFSVDGGVTWPNEYYITDNSDSIVLSNLSTGSYDIWARWGDNDCPRDVGDATIADTTIISVELGTDQEICLGSSVTLTAVADCGDGSYTYSWDNGLGTGASKTVSPIVPTTYIVTVTDGLGATTTDEVFVDITETQDITSIANTQTTCGQDNGTITIYFEDVAGRSGIEFSIDGGSTWPGAYSVADNSDSLLIEDLAIGSYDIWTRWGNNDCPKDVGDITITDTTISDLVCQYKLNDNLSWTDGSCNITVCEGDKVELSVNPDNLTLYEWTGKALDGTVLGNTNGDVLISNSIEVSDAGTYTVVASYGGTCTITKQIVITVNASPTVDAGFDEVINSGSTTIGIADNPALTYQWSTNSGNIGGATTSTYSANPGSTTTYYLTGTSIANGCSTIDSVRVTVASVNEICNNGIDDDGDGDIDCEDGDCAFVTGCSSFTVELDAGTAPQRIDNWMFGNNVTINFTAGLPTEGSASSITASESSTSFTGPSGDILFYSDGSTIWNADNDVMDNGDDIGGKDGVLNAAIAFQDPAFDDKMYLFVTANANDGGGTPNTTAASYAHILMSANNNKGEVISKNDAISGTSEGLTAIPNKNGKDIWVITADESSSTIYSTEVNEAGVQSSTAYNLALSNISDFPQQLNIAASGARDKIAVACYVDSLIVLYDFDDSTGVISNKKEINIGAKAYSVEFSPNGMFMYVSSFDDQSLLQFQINDTPSSLRVMNNSNTTNSRRAELSTAAIESSRFVLSSGLGDYGQLQIGPDTRIYNPIRGISLGAIVNPNASGLAAAWDASAISLDPADITASLPNHMYGGLFRSAFLLPVELAYFNVNARSNNAILEWLTNSEINNDYFSIERSRDAINWQSVGEVDGSGNSIINISYEFLDRNLAIGTYYYRLKQVDFDGEYEYSNVKSIQMLGNISGENEKKISVYPNPIAANGKLYFKGIEAKNELIVQIYSYNGRLIYSENISKELTLNLGNIEIRKGVYLIKLINGRQVYTDKLIIQ